MNFRFRVLRSLSWLLLALSWPAAVVGSVAAMASFRMPEIDLIALYRWSVIGVRVGLGAIFTAILLGWAHSSLAEPLVGVTEAANAGLRLHGWRRNGWAQMIPAVTLLALVLSAEIPGVHYVHPEATLWYVHGHVEVSAAVARLYLWRGYEWIHCFFWYQR